MIFYNIKMNYFLPLYTKNHTKNGWAKKEVSQSVIRNQPSAISISNQ
jgi:hypothetical protein